MRKENVVEGVQNAPHRSLFHALGLTEEEQKRPLIGIVSSYNEIVPGHMNIDKIVLGCTHYPFLRPLIEGVIGDRDIAVIDSGEAVARRVKWLLERYDIGAEEGHDAKYRFVSFADEEYRQRLEHRAMMIAEETK